MNSLNVKYCIDDSSKVLYVHLTQAEFIALIHIEYIDVD